MAKLEFIDIVQDVDISRFKSDNPTINTYLKTNAYYEHITSLTNTKLVKISNKLVAFYTTEIRMLEIPIDDDENLYPCVCLKFLAVDEKYERRGVGSIIIDILSRQVEDFKDIIPIRCLYIDAISDKIKWYRKNGFELLNKNDEFSDKITMPMIIDYRNNELVYDLLDE